MHTLQLWEYAQKYIKVPPNINDHKPPNIQTSKPEHKMPGGTRYCIEEDTDAAEGAGSRNPLP
jgi:hypothetical protein